MRPTIHSQEYPIKFNLKLPFQLRKKEEEQRRLNCVNIDGYKKRNWGQCIFDNIVLRKFEKNVIISNANISEIADVFRCHI